MRLPTLFFVVVALVGGYFVSVPLFGHLYGTLPDGTTTHILRQKDAEDCKAQLIKSAEPAPPVAREPDEVPSQDINQGEPACDFRPPKTVAWDWFHLPRALASHSAAQRRLLARGDNRGHPHIKKHLGNRGRDCVGRRLFSSS